MSSSISEAYSIMKDKIGHMITSSVVKLLMNYIFLVTKRLTGWLVIQVFSDIRFQI